MSSQEIQAYAPINLRDSIKFNNNLTNFPANGKLGQVILKSNRLWAYLVIAGYNVWYPLTSLRNSYLHLQGLASSHWEVEHNLNTINVITSIFDEEDNELIPDSIVIINETTLSLNFNTPKTGRIVVFNDDTILGLPLNGDIGQVVSKSSLVDGDVEWITLGSIATLSADLFVQKLEDVQELSYELLNKDINDIYTTTIYYRPNSTIARMSVLSNGTSPNYTTRTESFYDITGTTVLSTAVYTLSYDLDGKLISEILSLD
jgi:hypothetical protein